MKTDHIRHYKKQKSTLELFVIMLTQSVAFYEAWFHALSLLSAEPNPSYNHPVKEYTQLREYGRIVRSWQSENKSSMCEYGKIISLFKFLM